MSVSQHPIDRMIREIVASDRPVNSDEIAAIIARMAASPFNDQIVRVSQEYRGLRFQGRSLDRREDSLFLHLALRVVYDEQWAVGTTEAEYLADLRAAIVHTDARLAVFRRRGGYMAATVSPNHLSPQQLGRHPEQLIFTVYSADRSRIISGYQASTIEAIGIPGDARWLR